MTAYLLEDGVEKVMYLVDPRIAPQQEFDLQIYNLGLGISLQGDAFIWLMRPENETKANTWNQSMAAAFGMAKLKWVRVVSSKEASCYRTIVAKEDFPEPNWPQRTFEEYLDLAFRDRIISDLEHPVLRRLRGEIV